MKKIFALLIVLTLFTFFGISASATDEGINADNSTPEDENAATGENSGFEAVPETTPETVIEEEPFTDVLVNWFKSNFEEITVLVSLVGAALYSKIKDGKFSNSLGTLNGNAIAIAKQGADVAAAAAEKMTAVADKLGTYEGKFAEFEGKYEELIESFKTTESEKLKLVALLTRIEKALAAVKCAAVENADEIANLICLSGIPTAKKDEFYGKHLAAVHALEAIEEVKENDGKEA